MGSILYRHVFVMCMPSGDSDQPAHSRNKWQSYVVKWDTVFILNIWTSFKSLGPVVQSIASIMSSLMTNTLSIVAKVFSNTFIFCCKKVCGYCKSYTHCFSKKLLMYLPYFKVEILTSRLLIWTTEPLLSILSQFVWLSVDIHCTTKDLGNYHSINSDQTALINRLQSDRSVHFLHYRGTHILSRISILISIKT